MTLASDHEYNAIHVLEGDLAAFKLVDLDREGLAEYRAQLQKLGINYVGAEAAAKLALANATLEQLSAASAAGARSSASLKSISQVGSTHDEPEPTTN